MINIMMSAGWSLTARAVVQTLVYINITVKAKQMFAVWALQHDARLLVFFLTRGQVTQAPITVDTRKFLKGRLRYVRYWVLQPQMKS